MLVGRTTSPIKTNTLPTTTVASFSLAVTTGFGEKQKTDFIRVVAFGKNATNLAQYVVQGQELLVEGRLQNRSYNTQEGKREVTEVVLETFSFGQKPQGKAYVSQPATTLNNPFSAPVKPAGITTADIRQQALNSFGEVEDSQLPPELQEMDVPQGYNEPF